MNFLFTTRWFAFTAMALLAIGSTLFIAARIRGADQCHIITPPATLPSGGVAVVELFTSEGCSSCPPADKVLSKLVTDARKNGRKVYPLAFHVDYWNHLGWVDRMSSAEFSKRQQDYAQTRGDQQLYTPQMMVNGSVEFVGSDSDRANREITKALSQPASATVTVSAKLEQEKLHLDYTTANAAGMTLNIAVVERGLTSDVKNGENAGRQLQHDNVVRTFKQTKANAAGKIDLDLPAHLSPEKASVIAFISDPKTGGIDGAAEVDLVPAVAARQ
jgi:hypothetical protein